MPRFIANLVALFVITSLTTPLPCWAKTPENFSIVLILADDLGYSDVGCFGAKDIRTPNIGRLAEEGTRFTRFLVSQPVCTPSRASLMSGCYANRIGLDYSGDELQAIRSGDWKLHFPHDYLTVAGPPGRGGNPACVWMAPETRRNPPEPMIEPRLDDPFSDYKMAGA